MSRWIHPKLPSANRRGTLFTRARTHDRGGHGCLSSRRTAFSKLPRTVSGLIRPRPHQEIQIPARGFGIACLQPAFLGQFVERFRPRLRWRNGDSWSEYDADCQTLEFISEK